MYDIITIGSATRDVFLLSKSFRSYQPKKSAAARSFCFAVGDKVEVDDIFFATGGGGTNSAATFAQLGLKCACVSKIGNDPGGHASLEDLTKLKIDTRYLVKSPSDHTAYSVIISSPRTGRTVLVYRGASKNLQAKDIPWDKLGQARWLYITSLGGNISLLQRIINTARRSGVKIALNPGSGELKQGLTKLKPILAQLDVLLLNKEEASSLLKIEVGTEPKKIVQQLSAVTSPGIVVVTLGDKGVVAATGQQFYRADTLGGKIIERSGAGDAFGSGFVTGLIRQDSIKYAIQLGSANASSVIKYLGAKNGLLTKSQLPKIKKLKVTSTKL
ncbi:carbohydrate kinase family protein [Patescibacteria group bacterium]|nr:carbohydrate kinase family protein [Patescibacteria group bacterium]